MKPGFLSFSHAAAKGAPFPSCRAAANQKGFLLLACLFKLSAALGTLPKVMRLHNSCRALYLPAIQPAFLNRFLCSDLWLVFLAVCVHYLLWPLLFYCVSLLPANWFHSWLSSSATCLDPNFFPGYPSVLPALTLAFVPGYLILLPDLKFDSYHPYCVCIELWKYTGLSMQCTFLLLPSSCYILYLSS